MTVTSGCIKPVANDAYKMAGPCEVTNIKVASGGAGPVYVEFYDGADASDLSDFKWVADSASNSNDSDAFEGLIFKKGVIAKMTQGAGLNPVICIARRKYEATP